VTNIWSQGAKHHEICRDERALCDLMGNLQGTFLEKPTHLLKFPRYIVYVFIEVESNHIVGLLNQEIV